MMRRRRRRGDTMNNCEECGNQAKKECAHMRCRTCCNTRGFHCNTHVNSTWVPAAKRRQRQHQLSLLPGGSPGGQGDSSQNPKRGDPAASAAFPTIITATSTGLEVVGQFPAEVTSPAVLFRCVRVMSSLYSPNEQQQCAYETAVNIGGHVFKGILYDQGPQSNTSSIYTTAATHQLPSSGSTGGGGGVTTQHQQLDFLTAATKTDGSPQFDPSLYQPQPHLNAHFMAAAGLHFFPPPTS